MKSERLVRLVLSAWAAVFFLVVVLLPLGALFSEVLNNGSVNLFQDSVVVTVAKITFAQSVCSTGLSALFGLLIGTWLGKQNFGRFSSVIEGLFLLPFGIPTVIVAGAWVSILGRNGALSFLDWSYSLKAVILAHAFLNIPWVSLLVYQAMKDLSKDQIEAARTLGSGFFYEFLFLIWPKIRWAFANACCQVFALCLMSFAIVLILGGGPPVQTLETELYGQLRNGGFSTGISGAVNCALWELILAMIPWFFLTCFQYLKNIKITHPIEVKESVRGEKKLNIIYGVILGLIFLSPYFAVFNFEILSSTLKQPNWWSEVREPLSVSLILAGSCSFLTVLTACGAVILLGLSKTRRRYLALISILFSIPSGVSVMSLGLGLWLLYGRWLDSKFGNFVAILALQTALFFPIVLRTLGPVAQFKRADLFETAKLLGASPWRAFYWVEWPRWVGPIFSSLALVAGLSIGEVAAVSLFYDDSWVTLPVLANRWLRLYRFEQAELILVFLFVCSLFFVVGSFLLKNRFGNQYVKGSGKSPSTRL